MGSLGFLGLTMMFPRAALAGTASFAGSAAIQDLIDERVAAGQLPGAIVALGTAGNSPQFVFGGTLAFDSATKVDENTLWRLASMTKPVAGMAAMLLVAEGQLRLDQPIADIIPAFANMQVIPDPQASEARPAARPITLRHLITHTSGIVNDPPGTIAEAYRRLGLAGNNPAASTSLPPPESLTELAERLARVPLVADPGAAWHYSPNLDIVARIIEVVSGLPFDNFLDRRMFQPLGMTSTYFQVPERDKGRLMTMYARRDGAMVATDYGATSALLARPAIPRASGGLVSSARDYDRFMQMIVGGGMIDGGEVFPQEAVWLGTSNLLATQTDMSAYTSRTGFDGFGAGAMVTMGGPRPGTFGWGGSSGTTGFCNRALGSRWGSYTNVGASDFGRRALAAAGMTFSQSIMPGGAEQAAQR